VPGRVDPRYFRPTEVDLLLGDPTKAKQKLGWSTRPVRPQLCAEMVAAEEDRGVGAARAMSTEVHDDVRSAQASAFSWPDIAAWSARHRAPPRWRRLRGDHRRARGVDLKRQDQVERFLDGAKPDAIFMAAAKVGGILANTVSGRFPL
jgi:hypothetical protein